jgi:DNA-binding transcriptional ArsR family regulator
MPTERRSQVTDVRALRALANPVRYRIFSHLMTFGAQTASECAAVVGATPSNCSYHLRELARFGLVERVDDGAGDGRERPWRTTATGFSYEVAEADRGDPAAVRANLALVHAGIDDDARLAHEAADRHETLPPPWQRADRSATYGLRVTPDEMIALGSAIDALIRPYIGLTRDDPPSDAAPVHVVFRAFPVTAAT